MGVFVLEKLNDKYANQCIERRILCMLLECLSAFRHKIRQTATKDKKIVLASCDPTLTYEEGPGKLAKYN